MIAMRRTCGKWLSLLIICSTIFVMTVHYRSQDIEQVHMENLHTSDYIKLPRLNRPKSDSSKRKASVTCMDIKPASYNKADIQISSLVEDLDFHLDHGGHNESSFPDLKPLPNSESLRVFLIPHSHCDPGWLETYTKYYENKVRYILSWLYIFAMEHRDFKYIYAEVSFFKLWWEEQEADIREDMRMLAREGRFEFVQGGWVQTDEANTHYFAMFNEMLDGHDWLKKNIPEAIPKSGWAIDPFGLSPMMSHVNKLFGLTGMHIQRVHYSVKNHLAETRNLDFRWRQSWDGEGETDMLTHLGPFVSYGQQHSCGPDPDVCCMFNFMALRNGGFRQCFKNGSYTVPITQENVAERSLKILEQWRLKAALHSTNAVFIELGNDFTYALKEDSHLMYDNYKPIMEYINSQSHLNTKVSWGTLSEYFDHVRDHGTDRVPSLTGDFFTYSDRQADYWSGYYTSRPFYKNMDRVLESALRRTEILYSFYRSHLKLGAFEMARNTLSLFQHHDGITGTAKPFVVNDYGARLFNAYKTCNELTVLAIQYLLKERSPFFPISSRLAFNTVEKFEVLGGPSDLVLVNTLARDLESLQIIAIKNNHTLQVLGVDEKPLQQQTEPRIEYGVFHQNSKYIVYLVSLPSVSIQTHKLIAAASGTTTISRLDLYNHDMSADLQGMYYSRVHSEEDCRDIIVGLETLNIALDCKTGQLLRLTQNGVTHRLEQEILLYNNTAGAYLFRPVGAPEQQIVETSRPRITVIRGPLRHKAVVKFDKNIVISYIVNLLGGTDNSYIELEILTDLRLIGDLSMRFKTDISSGGSLFTDLNGHTIQQHKYKEKLKIQGNFFPMPSQAFIQDSKVRFSILSSEPHGVASLQEGYLEIILDNYSYFPTQDT
ncbi:hypothetical protein ACHWQZ_G012658 [Mnemiopsis leidyi]